ncbi:gamma-glutamyl-gamma-aminobutyrate hydrolase family protein [Mucisphaera sp.]|uniref:gamma-glutamyl-gamma-aminobutyrate hydrolase family protein n=1 Tax=Mucisphaera sp. TaxID=2913024 RepID=UPI003D103CD2
MATPIIGITADNQGNSEASGNYESALAYTHAVSAAGASPVILPHIIEAIPDYLRCCDGFVLTGGGDPALESFGENTDPRTTRMDPKRQAFEFALLAALDRVEQPVLGVCLGMQLMSLHAGGRLYQRIEDVVMLPQRHDKNALHPIHFETDSPWLPTLQDQVVSSHRQAVREAGNLQVIARAEDGLIEAVERPGARFYLGVQWHPERGDEGPLSRGLFLRLAEASASLSKTRC